MLKPIDLNIDERLRDHKFALEWRKAQAEVQAIDRKRIAELEAALRDCMPFLAVNMDKYRRDFGLTELHPTHAEILDRVSALVGGERLSVKLAE